MTIHDGNKSMLPYLFKYNSISHGVLAATYGYSNLSYFSPMLFNISSRSMSDIFDKEFGRIAYFFAHVILMITQLILSSNSTKPGASANVEPSDMRTMILGIMGHSLLIVYALWHLGHTGSKIDSYLFIVLQAGMVYFYATNSEPNESITYGDKPFLRRHLFLLLFASLAVYYVYLGVKNQQVYRYGQWMLAVTYILLFSHALELKK